MTLGSESETASAPTAAVLKNPSETFDQCEPPLVVFQTPPAQPPKKNVPCSVGWPATATARPPRCGPIHRHSKDAKRRGSITLQRSVQAANCVTLSVLPSGSLNQ